MNHKELKKIAAAVTSPTELNDFVQYGSVGAAIETVEVIFIQGLV